MFSLDVLTLAVLLLDIYMLLLYSYMYHLTSDVLLVITCHMLWYHLSPATCHVNTRPMIITFTGIMYLLSCIIYSDLYSYYTCALILLNF